jgi:hypothetical protein
LALPFALKKCKNIFQGKKKKKKKKNYDGKAQIFHHEKNYNLQKIL